MNNIYLSLLFVDKAIKHKSIKRNTRERSVKMAKVQHVTSFKVPPVNIDIYTSNGRSIYYRSNMEHVTGVLGVSNGGTGSSVFKENKILMYSGGKIVSTDVTKDELDALSGLPTTGTDSEGNTVPINMVDLLNGKVSGVRVRNDSDNTQSSLLDMDSNNHVLLPDYLLKTGGTISGNLTVNGDFKVGQLKMAWNDVTQCISFSII